MLYSITAEKARLDPVEGAATLNTMQWGWYSFGSLLGDIFAGPFQTAFGSTHAWMLCAVLFGWLGFCGVLYEDERNIEKEFNDSCAAHSYSDKLPLSPCSAPFLRLGILHSPGAHLVVLGAHRVSAGQTHAAPKVAELPPTAVNF
eukprot:SAG11_NODE_863_length_6839_cov_4.857418_3_plen_145_part_00